MDARRVFLGFLVSAFIFLYPLHSADECAPSDYTVSLSSTSSLYSNSSTLPRTGSHTYYVSVSAPGIVSVNVISARNRVLFSYSQSVCPAAGDPPAASSGSYIFETAGDFNLRIYRGGRGGGGRRGGNYTVEIAFTPNPPLADYRMDECVWSGAAREVGDSSGGDNNGTLTGSGAQTSVDGPLCRYGSFFGDAIDIDSLGVDSANGAKTTVMFWVRWDGADGDVPFGWSGYALRFLGGGFGFTSDNADLYGIDSSGLSGRWRHVAAVFVNGDLSAGKLYIDATEQVLSQMAGTPDNTRTFVQSSARIGGLAGSSLYRFGGGIDELKIYNGELAADEIKSIYDNESAGKNYDGSTRVCNDCGQVGASREALFNAVDRSLVCNAALDWDNNLTTKVAGSDISLSILAKDSVTGAPAEANITNVQLRYFASGDNTRCSGTSYRQVDICSGGCGLTDASGCLSLDFPASANDRAAKCVEVNIKGREITASRVSESNSSDNFSIRPDAIRFISPAADANLTAEREYFYAGGVTALYSDGSEAVRDYNTTLLPQGVKLMRNGEANASLAGTLVASAALFANGSGDLNISFSDVAKVTLYLEDTSWCAVDSDDTLAESRRIYGERNVTFIPSRFNVQFFSAPFIEDNDSAQRFTYLSNDLNMSAWARNLTVVVTALGEKNSTMQNFSNPMDRLFADPVDISAVLNLPAKHSVARRLFEPGSFTGADINFSSGEAFVNYADVPFNYDRSYTIPKDPFIVSGSEANMSVTVADAVYPAVAGAVFTTFDGNATFYYGRLRAEDIATTYRSVENIVEIEVFDETGSAFVDGFVQNSLRWFRNKKHTGSSSGAIKEANVTAGSSLAGAADGTIFVTVDRYDTGTAVLEINNSEPASKSRTIHLNIDRWLWYVPSGFGGAYDYSSSSDCGHHPCFRYSFETKGGSGGVISGDFNGSDFDTESMDLNATFERKEGVKLFR